MKVIAWFRDGSFVEVPMPETEWSTATPSQAIEYAKTQLAASEREQVKSYEVEEDFI